MKNLLIYFGLILLYASFVSSYDYCSDGNKGEIRITYLEDNLKENTDKWYWSNEDEVSLILKAKNNEDNRRDLKIELIFLDQNNNEVILSKEYLEYEFSISGGDEKEKELRFNLDNNLEIGKYTLYLKVYGEDENTLCQQVSREIHINELKYCKDEGIKLNSIYSDNAWEWKNGKEVNLRLNLNIPEEKDYTTELIFTDQSNNEVNLAEYKEDLIQEREIKENGTQLDFSFSINKNIKEGDYKMYVKISSSDLCYSEQIIKNDKENFIHIDETSGIKILEIKGKDELGLNSKYYYEVLLTNTGKDQEKVVTYLYNQKLGIKESQEILDFKKGTNRTLTLQIKTTNLTGNYLLKCYARYDYKNNKSRELTSDYDNDGEFSIKIEDKIELNNVEEVPNQETNGHIEGSVSTETKKSNKKVIVSIIILILIIGGVWYWYNDYIKGY